MSHHTAIHPSDVLRSIRENPRRIVVPMIVATLLAAAYAVVRPATWEAAQAMVVRDEVGDRLTRPGKFAMADEMKTTQETILELAKSRSVLTKALTVAGPPTGYPAGEAWPNEKAVEALQGSVKVSPPKGAEFGKTEVFYLKVQDSSRDRALRLAEAICCQLQARFSELREAKAHGTIDELNKSLSLAHDDLNTATKALSEMEQRVGSDLAELRILNESPSGDSDLRRMATDLDKELRGYKAAQTEGREFLKLLAAAQKDPTALLASPSVLLKAQPALGRLKDGLVDAQLRTGVALGSMEENHPLVHSARAAEAAIATQLHDEIAVAVRGVEADLRVGEDRIADVEQQNRAIQQRLGRLAQVRAEYSNLVSASKSRAESLKGVEHDLAEARASQAAARAASPISLIDSPDAGTRPAGPGKAVLVMAGTGAGLLIGLAIVLLTVRPAVVPTPSVQNTATVAPQPQLQVVAAPVAAPVVEPATRTTKSAGPLSIKQALQRVASL